MQNLRIRQSIVGFVILAYLLPVVFVNFLYFLYPKQNWIIVGIGFLVSSLSAVAAIIKMWQWEGILLEQVDVLAYSKVEHSAKVFCMEKKEEVKIPDANKEQEEPLKQLKKTNEELQLRIQEKEKGVLFEIEEKKGLQKQLEQIQDEFKFFKESSRGQLKQKDSILQEYQQIIHELRSAMEKKQQQIGKLEGSVNELTHEIKTLYNETEEIPSFKPTPKVASPQKISTPLPKKETEPLAVQTTLPFVENKTFTQKQAALQLKRCIDIAQKMTGAGHIGSSSKFKDVPIDSYALDQRRLFDNLRAESSNLIFVYSPREEKILFVNQAAKGMLGWSPEKFGQDFTQLLQDGYEDWKKAVSSLAMTREAQVPLVIKTRSGQDRFIQCQMGIIPSGVFKNHVVGILFEP